MHQVISAPTEVEHHRYLHLMKEKYANGDEAIAMSIFEEKWIKSYREEICMAFIKNASSLGHRSISPAQFKKTHPDRYYNINRLCIALDELLVNQQHELRIAQGTSMIGYLVFCLNADKKKIFKDIKESISQYILRECHKNGSCRLS